MRNTFRIDPLLYTRGAWAHPGDKAVKPPVEDGIVVDRLGYQAGDNTVCEGLGGAWCFCDGSASRRPVAERRRASWAVAFFSPEGDLEAKIRGPVWRNLPPTPQAGEYVGAVAAVQLVAQPTRLVGEPGNFNHMTDIK